MLSTLTVNVIGVLSLVLFGLFYWLGIFATTRAILAFVGTCLLGTAGFLGGLLHAATLWVTGLADSAMSWAVGVTAAGLVLTLVAGVIFIHDLHPKKTAGKRTGWAGVAFAALLIAGVSGVSSLNHVPGGVRQGVTSVRTVVGG